MLWSPWKSNKESTSENIKCTDHTPLGCLYSLCHSNPLSFVIEVTITLWPSVENKSFALAVLYLSSLTWHWCGVYYLLSRIRVSWGMAPIHNITALCWRYLKSAEVIQWYASIKTRRTTVYTSTNRSLKETRDTDSPTQEQNAHMLHNLQGIKKWKT